MYSWNLETPAEPPSAAVFFHFSLNWTFWIIWDQLILFLNSLIFAVPKSHYRLFSLMLLVILIPFQSFQTYFFSTSLLFAAFKSWHEMWMLRNCEKKSHYSYWRFCEYFRNKNYGRHAFHFGSQYFDIKYNWYLVNQEKLFFLLNWKVPPLSTLF